MDTEQINSAKDSTFETMAKAIRRGRIAEVRIRLNLGASPFLTRYLNNLVDCAELAGRLDIREVIVNHGLDHARSGSNPNCLMKSIISGRIDMALAALECGADPGSINPSGYSVLAFALARNDARGNAMASELLKRGADCMFKEPLGMGLLRNSIQKGDAPRVEMMLNLSVGLALDDLISLEEYAGQLAELGAGSLSTNQKVIHQILVSAKDRKMIEDSTPQSPAVSTRSMRI